MMRGEALRYLRFQVLDRTGPRVLAAWLIVAALLLPLHFAMRNSPPSPQALLPMVSQLHFQLACLAVVILFHGIVSEDRARGYFRFYLSKRVSPIWFYAQSVVLAVLAMLLFTAGFMALFSWAIVPLWSWSLIVSSSAIGLLIGGLIFLFSTMGQRDWLWMIVVTITATILRSRFPRADSTLGKVLYAILPPNHLVNEPTLTVGQWAWVGGWALGLFVLGFWLLRTRPLGED
jgi:hypothetical protein